MNQSTISMFCNASGFFDPVLSSSFGVASFDWSNNKATWAAAKPMTDEELLVEQARRTRAQGGAGRIFTYFNLVKCLPWYTTVREKLADPAYSGWFLKFDPAATPHVPPCDDVTGQCNPNYHDQLQTPSAHPGGDGYCGDYCDCGNGIPCGEYLWDHRNLSVRTFLVDVLLGPSFLAADGGGLISGAFIDDFWCSNLLNGTGQCTDPVQGPTEIDRHSQADMGLSDEDIRDITLGWLDTMTRAQDALVKAGGYTWSLMANGGENADASPYMIKQGASCAAAIAAACETGSQWQAAPLLMGLTPSNGTASLPFFDAELAAFLLMRGSHAYLGWGEWGMSWPAGMTWNSTGGKVLPLPQLLATGDWGAPLGLCVNEGAGTFSRVFPAGTVRLNCETYEATLPPSL
jgi:hypothetical protein